MSNIYASLVESKKFQENVNWDELWDVEIDLGDTAFWVFGGMGTGAEYFIGEYGFYSTDMIEAYLQKKYGTKNEIIVYGYHSEINIKSLNEIFITVDRIMFEVPETDAGYISHHKCRIREFFKVDWSWLLDYVDSSKVDMIMKGKFGRR